MTMNGTYGGARSIDEVLLQLDDAVAEARMASSRLGYFAALYRMVTRKVKDGIAQGFFEDGPRMERLDVTFANRYLDALNLHLHGGRPTGCWALSFEAARNPRLLILQHLLLGMNAHINYDLGIAAAETSPGAELGSLYTDFNKINAILAGLVGSVVDEIQELSPWIRLLDKIDIKAEFAVINFSMMKARDCAWNVAERLALGDNASDAAYLYQLGNEVAFLGGKVADPSFWLNLGLSVIRSRESGDIPRIIDVLGGTDTDIVPPIRHAV
ncbi:DUF5995 family protein [Paenibacillus caseinilyticus]|uniref:DUF5995 family protein n=1 Tax=Paenibacillus caseinilyticus TaxID=3098138 RepID=UPI0022B8B01B|nr:DUF5995 family protein [Paenibacillus caseinilyticus]MCZ8522470.1 DUF5995 family protein [Paenibacillus caseinilyticus]